MLCKRPHCAACIHAESLQRSIRRNVFKIADCFVYTRALAGTKKNRRENHNSILESGQTIKKFRIVGAG